MNQQAHIVPTRVPTLKLSPFKKLGDKKRNSLKESVHMAKLRDISTVQPEGGGKWLVKKGEGTKKRGRDMMKEGKSMVNKGKNMLKEGNSLIKQDHGSEKKDKSLQQAHTTQSRYMPRHINRDMNRHVYCHDTAKREKCLQEVPWWHLVLYRHVYEHVY